jgi:putative SOS response-associated peptidase YedK
MCGRYTLTLSLEALEKAFPEVKFNIEHTPRFNVAPSQMIPVIRKDANGTLRADLLKWGLIPSWSKDEKIGFQLINARAETVAEKPSFRGALKFRRCLILADGFYEWVNIADTKVKLPIYFLLKSRAPFAFAGLWETWAPPNRAEINSATIITTEPNALVGKFHDRMPVILPHDAYMNWLTPNPKSPGEFRSLLKPFPEAQMECYPVSTLANSAKNESPEVILPLPQRTKIEPTIFPI